MSTAAPPDPTSDPASDPTSDPSRDQPRECSEAAEADSAEAADVASPDAAEAIAPAEPVDDPAEHRFECLSCGFVYDPAEGVRKLGQLQVRPSRQPRQQLHPTPRFRTLWLRVDRTAA